MRSLSWGGGGRVSWWCGRKKRGGTYGGDGGFLLAALHGRADLLPLGAEGLGAALEEGGEGDFLALLLDDAVGGLVVHDLFADHGGWVGMGLVLWG